MTATRTDTDPARTAPAGAGLDPTAALRAAPRARTRVALLRPWWRLRARRFPLAKRMLDVMVAGAAILVLLPLFALVALLIWLTDRGPVLFWQRRVGRDGVEFDFPKLRSMVVNAEALRAAIAASNQHGAEGVTFKMARDPRITWIGRFIRRGSIDELPQLWCVLRGEMTLVGPRPPLPAEVARYTQRDRLRLSVTPGLTCIWQVSGRSDIPFDRQVEMDLDYIRRRSLRQDVSLLARTLPAVVTGRGAY